MCVSTRCRTRIEFDDDFEGFWKVMSIVEPGEGMPRVVVRLRYNRVAKTMPKWRDGHGGRDGFRV